MLPDTVRVSCKLAAPPVSFTLSLPDALPISTSFVPDRDRMLRILDPAAPRWREQARTGEPRVFHREQVVACGDAGTAHVHDCAGIDAAEQAREFAREFGCGLEAAVGLQVVAEGPVARAGYVARGRVQRFDIAAVARCGA